MARSISSVASSGSSSALSIKSPSSQSSRRTKLSMKTRIGPVDKRKRLAANARERKRMDLLNKAFDQLRGRLNDARNKSKYDVLVQAKEYIQALARICAEHDRENPKQASSSADTGRLLEATHEHETERRHEAKLEARNGAEVGQQLDLTTRSVALKHWQQAVQSPASSSDCCLSPVSLPESLGSSGSPQRSSHPHQSHYHDLAKVYPKHLSMSNTAFLYRAQIKQEPIREIPIDYHQLYHPHYQSFFQAQKQASIN